MPVLHPSNVFLGGLRAISLKCELLGERMALHFPVSVGIKPRYLAS